MVDGEPDERTGLRRLYVALTRAVSGLIVTHAAALPPQLASRPSLKRQRRACTRASSTVMPAGAALPAPSSRSRAQVAPKPPSAVSTAPVM